MSTTTQSNNPKPWIPRTQPTNTIKPKSSTNSTHHNHSNHEGGKIKRRKRNKKKVQHKRMKKWYLYNYFIKTFETTLFLVLFHIHIVFSLSISIFLSLVFLPKEGGNSCTKCCSETSCTNILLKLMGYIA